MKRVYAVLLLIGLCACSSESEEPSFFERLRRGLLQLTVKLKKAQEGDRASQSTGFAERILRESVEAATTLPQAVEILKPHFINTDDNPDPAARLLLRWQANHMDIRHLATLERTTALLFLKDIERERGKVFCIEGNIGIIGVNRELGFPYASGVLVTDPNVYVSFFTAGSTGDLVQGNDAKFCGVATGRHIYSNTGGGKTGSIRAVGMFVL